MCFLCLGLFLENSLLLPPSCFLRAAKEGALPADCAEEECDADEIKEQTGLFESYMASRYVYVCVYLSSVCFTYVSGWELARLAAEFDQPRSAVYMVLLLRFGTPKLA